MRATFLLMLLAGGLLAGPASAKVAIIAPVPPPRPVPPPDTVWIEPSYKIIYEKIWVPDRIERIPERVWVRATYGWREIICYDEDGHRIVRREWGIITPAHWETRYREVVIEGHWEYVPRRVIDTPGRWDPRPWGNPPKVGVDGYAPAKPDPDAGKFSPLHEWPK